MSLLPSTSILELGANFRNGKNKDGSRHHCSNFPAMELRHTEAEQHPLGLDEADQHDSRSHFAANPLEQFAHGIVKGAYETVHPRYLG